MNGWLRLSCKNSNINKEKIIIDTNIITYIGFSGTVNPIYEAIGTIANLLVQGTCLVIISEMQIKEIDLALYKILISKNIIKNYKKFSIDRIRNDIIDLFKNLESIGILYRI